MKHKTIILSLIFAFQAITLAKADVGAVGSQFQQPESGLRMHRLGEIMDLFPKSANNTSMTVMSFFPMGNEVWRLKWNKKNADNWRFNEEMTSKRVLELAFDWTTENLPDELRPKKSDVAYIICLKLKPEAEQWIWIVDFMSSSKPSISTGPLIYPSLPIAVTPAGEVITEFVKGKTGAGGSAAK